MPQALTNSPTKTRPLPKTSTFPPRIKELVQICHTYPEMMTVQSYPVAIGTRGTVGSLITQEIEYFSRLQLGARSSSSKPLRQLASSGESAISVPEKKKKRASNRLIPSMCSVVEVAEFKQAKTACGFAYRSLKADVKRSQSQT